MTSSARWGLAACASMVVFGVAGSAQAQDAAADAAAAQREGVRLAELERWPESVASFRTSLALDPRPEAACNLGLALEHWEGHASESVDAYERCASLDTDGTYRDHALERAEVMREQVLRDAQRPQDTPPEGGNEVVVPLVPVVPHAPPPSHGMLFGGLAVVVAGGALIAGGAIAAGNARDDETELLARYPDGQIPGGDVDSVSLLADAERRRNIGLGLYIGAGVLVAVGTALVIIDLAGANRPTARVAVVPTRDGVAAAASVSF